MQSDPAEDVVHRSAARSLRERGSRDGSGVQGRARAYVEDMTTEVGPIRTILCPVDFSATSEQALHYALELARPTGARVHVLHVFDLPLYVMPEGAMMATPRDIVAIRQSLQRDLEKLREKYPAIASVRIEDGVPFRQIDAVAKELQADLIVLGTHGRSGFSRLLLGSVAEKVVRTAPVPVLTVHLPAEAQPIRKSKKVAA